MVLYPAPARTMSDRRPASSIAAVTFVPRTTSTSAPLVPIDACSVSSFSSGWYSTPQPAAASPSRPLFSNASATSTFIRRSDDVDQQPVAELGFEPGGFRRHDPAAIRDGHEVVDGDRMHRERDRRLPRVDGLLQDGRPA